MTMKIIILSFTILLIGTYGNAALTDNGDGTITDTDTNLMWLKDANYSYTSGYDDDGKMNWYDGNSWANNLVFAGYDDWRLPIGQGPSGYNFINSEMGHLYYTELGGAEKNPPSDWSPFINVQLYDYLSSTDADDIDDVYAWHFGFGDGSQGLSGKAAYEANSLPVRDCGGSCPTPIVPEPISSLLFITGGSMLGSRYFIRKKTY